MNVETKAEPVAADLSIEEMRDIARKLVPWVRRFDALLDAQKGRRMIIAQQAGVSWQRLGRYQRNEVTWLSIAEYLKIFAVLTLTEIPDLPDDPIKKPEFRSRPGTRRRKPKKDEVRPFGGTSFE